MIFHYFAHKHDPSTRNARNNGPKAHKRAKTEKKNNKQNSKSLPLNSQLCCFFSSVMVKRYFFWALGFHSFFLSNHFDQLIIIRPLAMEIVESLTQKPIRKGESSERNCSRSRFIPFREHLIDYREKKARKSTMEWEPHDDALGCSFSFRRPRSRRHA